MSYSPAAIPTGSSRSTRRAPERAAGDTPDRSRCRPRGRRRARRPHHGQHCTHRRDVRHRRWAAVRLVSAAEQFHVSQVSPSYWRLWPASLRRRPCLPRAERERLLPVLRRHYCDRPRQHRHPRGRSVTRCPARERSPHGRDGHPVGRRRSEQRLIPCNQDEVWITHSVRRREVYSVVVPKAMRLCELPCVPS
jgi:hypothetical protein